MEKCSPGDVIDEEALSRMKPKLLTWGEGETVTSSMTREKLSSLAEVVLVPRREPYHC